MSNTIGPRDPHDAIKGNMTILFAFSEVLSLISPIMVNVVTATHEVMSPARTLRMAQDRRSVANPILICVRTELKRANFGELPTQDSRVPCRIFPLAPPDVARLGPIASPKRAQQRLQQRRHNPARS